MTEQGVVNLPGYYENVTIAGHQRGAGKRRRVDIGPNIINPDGGSGASANICQPTSNVNYEQGTTANVDVTQAPRITWGEASLLRRG